MTIGLIFLYSRTILKSWGMAAMTASILTILYGFIFIIIQLEDLALLFGSLGIFLVLAITMYFSRKIDWFDVKESGADEVPLIIKKQDEE
jgi:inner membrane protein